jgi:hypothetical protein
VVAEYLSQYLSKAGWKAALFQGFKARRVCYSQGGWRAATMQWAWNTAGAAAWRPAVALVANRCALRDLGDFWRRFGRQWAYSLREVILSAAVEIAAEPFCVPAPAASGSN